MTEIDLNFIARQNEQILAEIQSVRSVLASVRAHADGLPLLNRRVINIEQQVRALRAAFNDFALTNPTKGEIEALHEDVNRVQAEYAELATRLATVERLLHEREE